MPAEPYRYDIFISYSSADQSWAENLFEGLERKGLGVFLDRTRLQLGARWEPALQQGVSASQHLVVLWSENARQSDWVLRELGLFDSQIINPNPGQESADRRIIFLLLEGEPRSFSSYQMLTDLRDAQAYPGSAGQVDPNYWERVLNKVREAIVSADPAIPVTLAVLTITQERLDKLKLTEKPQFAERPLSAFLASMGIKTKKQLKQYYGARQMDWCPFGDEINIGTMLSQLKDEINKKFVEEVGGEQFRWEVVGDKFWSTDNEGFLEEVRKLRKGLSVVVVDPIALYDSDVHNRLTRLSHQLRRAKVLFLTPLPWRCWETHHGVREHIRLMAEPVFAGWYEPFPPDSSEALWFRDANVGDEMEIKRALLTTLGQHLTDSIKQPASEYLRQR